jgi:hypothetical protein
MVAKKKTKKSKSVKAKPSKKSTAPKNVSRRKKGVAEREHGPASWLLPTVEATYTSLRPRDAQVKPAAGSKAIARSTGRVAFKSALQPQRGEEVLASADQKLWRDRLAEYKKRKA